MHIKSWKYSQRPFFSCAKLKFFFWNVFSEPWGLWMNVTLKVCFLPYRKWRYTVLRASLVAQTVKNLPAMQDTQDRSLGWEDALEKENSMVRRNLVAYSPWGFKESDMTVTNTYTHTILRSGKHNIKVWDINVSKLYVLLPPNIINILTVWNVLKSIFQSVEISC